MDRAGEVVCVIVGAALGAAVAVWSVAVFWWNREQRTAVHR